MHSRVVDQLEPAEVAAAERLTDGDFYASPGWWRYEAMDGDSTASFALIHDRDELVAATPLYVVKRESNRRYDPRRLLHDTHRLPTLLVGSRRGYAGQLAVTTDERRASALAALAEVVDSFARDHTGGVSWWTHLRERDVVTLRGAGDTIGPWLVAAEAAIPLPGSTMDDYLDSLPRKRRATVRTDRRRFREAGLTTRSRSLHEAWRDLAPLVGAHQRQHGHDQGDSELGDLMRRQAEAAGSQGIVHEALAPAPVAAALSFASRRHVTARAFGSVLTDRRSGEYFELAYYQPMEHAYDHGLRELHLGVGTLAPKILRGARVQLRWTVARGLGAASSCWREHNETEAAAVLAEINGATGVLLDDSRRWLEDPSQREATRS